LQHFPFAGVTEAFAAFLRLGNVIIPRSCIRLFLGGFSVSIVSSVNQLINWRMCKKQQMWKEPIRTGAPAMETRSA
jgi:hypothetical protein